MRSHHAAAAQGPYILAAICVILLAAMALPTGWPGLSPGGGRLEQSDNAAPTDHATDGENRPRRSHYPSRQSGYDVTKYKIRSTGIR